MLVPRRSPLDLFVLVAEWGQQRGLTDLEAVRAEIRSYRRAGGRRHRRRGPARFRVALSSVNERRESERSLLSIK